MAYKVTLANLGDLRADLRFTQDEMADAMDIVRQSVANMEKGQPFDYRFVDDAFDSLKKSVGDQFAELELLETEGDRERLRISYVLKKSLTEGSAANAIIPTWSAISSLKVDPESHIIMIVTTRIREYLRDRDDYIKKYHRELEDLKDALHRAIG